jgi:hypothetical protein
MTDELEKALDGVWMAIDCYREDCISSDEWEDLRTQIGEQFNLIESTLVQLHIEKQNDH